MQEANQLVPTEIIPVLAMAQITCGLDVHKDKIDACIRINDGTVDGKIFEKTFSAMRGALIELRDWILSFNCFKVLMESTGVYWMPIYFLLEEVLHMDVGLGNAQHMKNTPGRPKTDKEDARWLSRLCMLGYILKSFIVAKPFRDLREYTRYHKKLVQERARHVNRIEKLLQMNGFKLSSVLSDITGVSGLRILSKLCNKSSLTLEDVRESLDPRAKKTPEEISYAINGVMKPSSCILLKMQLVKLASCDKDIEEIYKCMIDLSKEYDRAIRIISSIPGYSNLSAIYIIAEIGTDLSSFKTSNHLTAWAGLAPKGDQSADKVGPKKTKKANRYLKSILVECARASVKARNSRLSMWYWSKVNALGDKKAITAVARKSLCYIYAMLKNDTLYDASLDRAQKEKNKATKLDSAQKTVDSNKKHSEVVKKQDNFSKKPNDLVENQIQPEQTASGNQQNTLLQKKRGRPKKNTDSTSEDVTIITAGQSQAEFAQSTGEHRQIESLPIPKKRGRPRKNMVSTENSSALIKH